MRLTPYNPDPPTGRRYVPPTVTLTDNDGHTIGAVRADDLIAALIVTRVLATAGGLLDSALADRLALTLSRFAAPGVDPRLTRVLAVLSSINPDDPDAAIRALEAGGRL